MTERVILVDECDRPIGEAEKLAAHRAGALHRSFSVFVFNSNGELLLQKRNKRKYHSGGLWSNACCGHPRPGEEVGKAAQRRLQEEMGFACELKELFQFLYKVKLDHGLWEHEFDHTFSGIHEGAVHPDLQEAEEFKWVAPVTVLRDAKEHPGKYTEWFKIALPLVFDRSALQL